MPARPPLPVLVFVRCRSVNQIIAYFDIKINTVLSYCITFFRKIHLSLANEALINVPQGKTRRLAAKTFERRCAPSW
jgi:hypothetical protein